MIIPFASTVVIWWLGTILLLAFTRNLDVLKTRKLMFVSALLMQLGFFGLYYFSDDSMGSLSAYGSFFSAILVWVWLESSFLAGWITGSRKTPCSPNTGEFTRLTQAFQAVSHHELHIAILAVLIFLITKDSVNNVGFVAFLILWGM